MELREESQGVRWGAMHWEEDLRPWRPPHPHCGRAPAARSQSLAGGGTGFRCVVFHLPACAGHSLLRLRDKMPRFQHGNMYEDALFS